MKYISSSGVKEANKIEREVCEPLHNIQNSFHSVFNAFTALEMKCNEIVCKNKPGME